MLGNLSGWHLLIVFAVILLLFGATRLPTLSRSLGQSMRIFRKEVRELNEESTEDKTDGGPDPRSSHVNVKRDERWSNSKPDKPR